MHGSFSRDGASMASAVRLSEPFWLLARRLIAGLFYRLWRVAARRYDEVQGLDWRWLSVDGCLTKAPLSRSEVVGRNPTDRGKQGVKRSLLVDGRGVPLALVVGPANRNGHLLLADTLDGLVARRPPRSALVQHL